MVISIYPLLSNAHNFSPFFFFALLPPSPLPRCFTFLACGLRAPGIPIRFAECTRLYEAYNGKRRFNASLADNRFEYQQLRTLISPCADPRFEPTHGAYLSDNGQARILKDASTVTTSSMTPNVMYITPRCTSENM